MRIKLDEEMSSFISQILGVEIKEIYLDSASQNIKNEFVDFIRQLLERRTWTTVANPYTYNKKKKLLGIYKYDKVMD